MKIISFVMLLSLLGLVSCSHSESSNQNVARKSEPIRRLLVKYYESKGHFPNDGNSLKELDPQISFQGPMWNEWSYTSYDPDEYNMWTYPSKWSRQSLWLKFNAKDATKTGWFINNDNGDFQPQPIPLLPEEQKLLQKSSR